MNKSVRTLDPAECIRGIQQLLVSDKKKIAFLFGAGTSLAKKNADSPYVPAMEKMTELVVEHLKANSEKGDSFSKAIDEIKTELEHYSQCFNIEMLLSNIEEKIRIIGAGTLNNLNRDDLQTMDACIRAKIQELVSIHNKIKLGEEASLIQYDFAKWICNAERRSAVEIFTTNYDYLFEIGLEAMHVPYYDGFTGSYKPFFNPDSLEDMGYLPKQTKLWKIHGSLGLHEEGSDTTKKIIRKNSDKDDLLIYPSSLKYSNCKKQPYASFMDRLNEFLKQDDSVLFVCGYSFNDDHINERILSALNSNTTAHVFVLYYDIIWYRDADGKEVKKYTFDIDDALAKIAVKTRKMSVLATKSAVIGGQYGIWSLKRKPEGGDALNIQTYFAEEQQVKDIPWSGKGELILPDFSMFTAFLKNMIPETNGRQMSMSKFHTEIGSVISVSGNTIVVQLSDSVKSNSPIIDGIVYRIGQVGSFLRIPLGYTSLFGIVTQVGAAALPERLKEAISENLALIANQQWLSMTLIGEQIGSKFERGVSQSPTTGDTVHLVTIQDLVNVYGGYDEAASINIGNISVSESLNAYLNLDKLVSRHFAILGSTGSGKSNAVGIVLNSIIEKKFGRTRILLLDPHGEYNSVFGGSSTIYRINATNPLERLYIPYWALSFAEFISLFDGNISEQNKEYFRTKVLEAKLAGAVVNNLNIEASMITADSPIPFSLKQLWFDLDDFERQTYLFNNDPTKPELLEKGDADTLKSSKYKPASNNNTAPFLNKQAKYILPFLDSIRSRLLDNRYDFLFQPGQYTPDLTGKIESDLSSLLISWVGNEKPITILDISDVPSEIMMSIAGTLLNIAYEALFWGQAIEVGGRQQPLLIVLEEAHNYLRSGEKSIASRTVQRIAKEGRKYGVGLMLVTQRPSELDETVLSQCGTIIALRMNNSKDRAYVSAAIQDELKTLVDLLPSLRTGEAIISGEGVSIPSRVQFYKLSNAQKSSDPEVSKCWNKAYTPANDRYEHLVAFWRKKKFEMEVPQDAK